MIPFSLQLFQNLMSFLPGVTNDRAVSRFAFLKVKDCTTFMQDKALHQYFLLSLIFSLNLILFNSSISTTFNPLRNFGPDLLSTALP
jgi:Na+-translocating ferredoxin:NAD+ oxidoreductase RnfA subunit